MSDASAERSAAGCTITLSEASVTEYLNSNITLLKWMISEGYGDARTISRRVEQMQEWLANPSLMRADDDAEYAIDITIDMSEIKEPILCCPNDPDDAKTQPGQNPLGTRYPLGNEYASHHQYQRYLAIAYGSTTSE